MDKITDQQVLEHERAIKREFNENQPLVSSKMDTMTLYPEYESSETILKDRFKKIAQHYPQFRSVRRDGNCFYRAFLFQLAENYFLASQKKSQSPQILKTLAASKDYLVQSGYDLFAVEDFYDMIMDAFQVDSFNAFIEKFTTEYISDALICYFRLLTAAKLKENADHFQLFLSEEYLTLDQFIGAQVEPMNIEADHIHIVALADYFNVKVSVVTLDASKSDQTLISHEFYPFNTNTDTSNLIEIKLFFKPGHYDILYSN